MLNALRDLFANLGSSQSGESPADPAHELQLATAVMLVEVVRADATLQAAERTAMLSALREKFALSDEELNRLVALAEDTASGANDYFRFTSSMNDQFSQAEKIKVVELMWQVAYSDARLGDHERHLISKIAGLLHVTHGEYIAAKLRAHDDARRKQRKAGPDR